MVFHWSLSDRKFLQVSRTLLDILVDLKNSWMVSICPLISKSSDICTYPLMTASNAPLIISITITFMFHSFFSFFYVLISLSLSFSFTCGLPEWQSSLFSRISFFLSTINRTCPLAGICLSVCIQNPWAFCALHFLRQILGWAYIICSYGRHPSSIVLYFFAQFTAFVDYVIDCFVSVTT